MVTVAPEPPFLPLRILGVVLRWAPVWVPALLFWQFATAGLKPALAEQDRLEQERPVVEQRHLRSEQRLDEMMRTRRAIDDPVFIERSRRYR